MKVIRNFAPSYEETLQELRAALPVGGGTPDDLQEVLTQMEKDDPRVVTVAGRIVGDVPDPVGTLHELIVQMGPGELGDDGGVPTFGT
jgi:hypothetical protein